MGAHLTPQGKFKSDKYPECPEGKVPLSTKFARVGVAVLVRRGDGALLMELRKGAHGAGTWSVPGGKLERGESVLQCAARELLEETGLAPAGIRETGVYTLTHFEGGDSWVTLYCCVDLPGYPVAQVTEPEKCAEWRWVPWVPPGPAPETLFSCFASLMRVAHPWTLGRNR